MRILTISSTFYPRAFGGAEISALNLCRWLFNRGHTMGVLTTTDIESEVTFGARINGIPYWRLKYPHPYPFWRHEAAPKWQKPLWHAQDHFDPRNRQLTSRVLDQFRPDFALIHTISGIGYNSLLELAARDIPSIYFMHDLNLVCGRGGVFKGGKDCPTQCNLCTVVSQTRLFYVHKIPRLSFCSPSEANLATAQRYSGRLRGHTTSILNANAYPAPTVERVSSDFLRFIYVGRIHKTKGVDILLSVLDDLSQSLRFSIEIVGTGPEEAALRSKYGSAPWCHFRGFVSPEQVSNHMINSDVLCIPSIWQENSPGVVVHALSQGLPVVGSRKGGIPELIRDGETGALVEPGDPAAWRDILANLIRTPDVVAEWRENALKDTERFQQDQIGEKIFGLIQDTVNGRVRN